MQWSNSTLDLSEVKRYDKARVLAMVSHALDQAHAEPGREYTAVEEWLDRELSLRCTARQTDGGQQVELAIRYLRLDRG